MDIAASGIDLPFKDWPLQIACNGTWKGLSMVICSETTKGPIIQLLWLIRHMLRKYRSDGWDYSKWSWHLITYRLKPWDELIPDVFEATSKGPWLPWSRSRHQQDDHRQQETRDTTARNNKIQFIASRASHIPTSQWIRAASIDCLIVLSLHENFQLDEPMYEAFEIPARLKKFTSKSPAFWGVGPRWRITFERGSTW
jgi:hypothetical protein